MKNEKTFNKIKWLDALFIVEIISWIVVGLSSLIMSLAGFLL